MKGVLACRDHLSLVTLSCYLILSTMQTSLAKAMAEGHPPGVWKEEAPKEVQKHPRPLSICHKGSKYCDAYVCKYFILCAHCSQQQQASELYTLWSGWSGAGRVPWDLSLEQYKRISQGDRAI